MVLREKFYLSSDREWRRGWCRRGRRRWSSFTRVTCVPLSMPKLIPHRQYCSLSICQSRSSCRFYFHSELKLKLTKLPFDANLCILLTKASSLKCSFIYLVRSIGFEVAYKSINRHVINSAFVCNLIMAYYLIHHQH